MQKKKIICACGCGRKKMVRLADIKRGWGKYFSKSCKARAMLVKRTVDGVFVGNNYSGFTDQEQEAAMFDAESGWDSHKNITKL